MIIWCEVVLDVSSREVLSFAISESRTSRKAEALLRKPKISGSCPGRVVEVDKYRLDVFVEPDSA
jgi:hypothetical protein